MSGARKIRVPGPAESPAGQYSLGPSPRRKESRSVEGEPPGEPCMVDRVFGGRASGEPCMVDRVFGGRSSGEPRMVDRVFGGRASGEPCIFRAVIHRRYPLSVYGSGGASPSSRTKPAWAFAQTEGVAQRGGRASWRAVWIHREGVQPPRFVAKTPRPRPARRRVAWCRSNGGAGHPIWGQTKRRAWRGVGQTHSPGGFLASGASAAARSGRGNGAVGAGAFARCAINALLGDDRVDRVLLDDRGRGASIKAGAASDAVIGINFVGHKAGILLEHIYGMQGNFCGLKNEAACPRRSASSLAGVRSVSATGTLAPPRFTLTGTPRPRFRP